MRLFGRALLVLVVVSLGFAPVRVEAATISASEELLGGGDVFFIPFTITETSLLSLDITAGFVPVVTLFGPVTDGVILLEYPSPPDDPTDPVRYQWITDFQAVASDSILLTDIWELPGVPAGTNYVLAVTQDPNRFEPLSIPGGWVADIDPTFFETLAAFCTAADCDESVEFVNAGGARGTPGFTARFELEPVSAPEPATLSLLFIGAAAIVGRRRRKLRASGPS